MQVQSKFLLTTQLSVEGPIRMKEEYVEGLIEIPRIREETLPDQLKGFFGQTAGALQQLPAPIRDAVSEGIKLPLSKECTSHFHLQYFAYAKRVITLPLVYIFFSFKFDTACHIFLAEARYKQRFDIFCSGHAGIGQRDNCGKHLD